MRASRASAKTDRQTDKSTGTEEKRAALGQRRRAHSKYTRYMYNDNQ